MSLRLPLLSRAGRNFRAIRIRSDVERMPYIGIRLGLFQGLHIAWTKRFYLQP